MKREDIQKQLSEQWLNRDPDTIVNEATRSLLRVRGDWDPPAGIEPKRTMIRMAIGIPDGSTLPKAELQRASSRVINQPGEGAFVYGFGMGYNRLRALLAERYSSRRGLQVDEDWFQLANGSSGAIDLICRTLIDPGDVIITESPTYMGTLRNFRGVMADIRAVQMDEQGLQIDKLEALIVELKGQGKRIKFIYTIATFHNPTGATLSLERRLALLKLAAEHNILILDDDAYGDLYFGDSPPPALSELAGGHGVVTVGTFSKTLATGLRVGWIHAEPGLVNLMGKMRFAMGLNQIMVRVVADYMEDGKLDDHIDHMRQLYYNKMVVLADALDKYCGRHLTFTRPLGGFYLWAGLNNLSAESVWRTGTEEGVSFTPGTNFFPDRQDPSGEHIRIAYPWTSSTDLIEGARRLGLACDRVASGDSA